MFVFRRPVRFAEVDAAGLVFFPRYHEYCHDALEALLAALPGGGYANLFGARGLGVPTVHLTTDFEAPLRYGDVAMFETTVVRIGTSSIRLRHLVRRERDGATAARIEHVVVTARISELAPVPVPEDLRTLLAPHLLVPDEPARAGS